MTTETNETLELDLEKIPRFIRGAISEAAKAYARDHGLRCDPYYHDSALWYVRKDHKRLVRSVQICVTDRRTICFIVSVWRDDKNGRRANQGDGKIIRHPVLQKDATDTQLAELTHTIRSCLNEAWQHARRVDARKLKRLK